MNIKSWSSKALLVSGTILATAISASLPAQAFTYIFGEDSTSSNAPATGAAAKVDFGFEDAGAGKVRIKLDIFNTTGNEIFGEGATSSKLTGIGFNLFEGMSIENNSFAQEAGDDGNNLDTLLQNASFNPFGTLDVGIADNNNFLGGNANQALAQGKFNAVSLVVSGLESGETAESFGTRFEAAISNGKLNIGARFQQVNGGNNNGASDKLSGGTIDGWNPEPTNERVEVPEPTNVLGLGLAAGILVLGVKKRRSQEQAMLTA